MLRDCWSLQNKFSRTPSIEDVALREVSHFVNALLMFSSVCALYKNNQFSGACTAEVSDKLHSYLSDDVNGMTSKIDNYKELVKLYTQKVDGRLLEFWDIMRNMMSVYNEMLLDKIERQYTVSTTEMSDQLLTLIIGL